jgi:ParB family chromosome partitioning protein
MSEPLPLQVEVERIAPNSLQPRGWFDEAKIDELAASVREQGILQPLVVRHRETGYELIAGERRLRAAVKAGFKTVPVIVREANDHEALQLALVENLQREDLNPVEEARAFERLHDEFGWKQDEIADRVGKSRSTVANSMRLLALPSELQQEIAHGRLSMGQARALLSLERDSLILAAAREVMNKELSARETERLVRRLKSDRKNRKETGIADPDIRLVTEKLQRWLGTKVRLLHRAKSTKGRIEIEYYSLADLERIIRRIMPDPA